MNTQTLFASSLLALVTTTQAYARSTPVSSVEYVVVSLGQFIAAQGNEALREMRDELKKDISKTLKPVLPMPAAQPAERQ